MCKRILTIKILNLSKVLFKGYKYLKNNIFNL